MKRTNENVTAFLSGATTLLNTSRQFSDIYRYIVNNIQKVTRSDHDESARLYRRRRP